MAVLFTLVSCSGSGDGKDELPDGKIVLTSDKTMIFSDGTDKTQLTVTLTDAGGVTYDVTEQAEIYVNDSKQPMGGSAFTATNQGEHRIYAVYGMNISETINVIAADRIPQIPADPQAANTAFKHRMLLVQHTGTGCVNCPRMMNSLKELSEDEQYNTLYHHVASHSYNKEDAAYSDAAVNLSTAYCSSYYPELTFNLTKTSTGTDLGDIKAKIDELKKDTADAGVAASAETYGNTILVKTEMKAAVENDYRIAIWLLEDGIYSHQTGASESWHNTHNNALRLMAGSSLNIRMYGERVGKVAAGSKVSNEFILAAQDTWKMENCKVLVLVTASDGKGNYDIVNCTVCNIGSSVTYEYK